MAIVSSGVVTSGVILSYDKMYVQSGGVANNTDAYNMGWIYVSDGGIVNSTTVNNVAWMWVSSGGTANHTTATYNGCIAVSSGGVINDTAINDLCRLSIYGGTANNVIISNGTMWISGGSVTNTVNYGGRLMLSTKTVARDVTHHSGGMQLNCTADNVIINGGYTDVYKDANVNNVILNGGSMTISGGTVNNITVNSGCNLAVFSGSVLAIKENGGYIYSWPTHATISFVENTISGYNLLSSRISVHSGTTALNTTINSGGIIEMRGGVTTSTTINDSGYLFVSSEGGTTVDTTINSGGSLSIETGTASNTVINASGSMTLHGSCTLRNTILNPFGYLKITEGVAYNTVINGSGYVTVGAGDMILSDTTINSGGSLRVYGSAVIAGATVNSGGTLYISGSASAVKENGGCVFLNWGNKNVTFVSNTLSGFTLTGMASLHSGTTAVDLSLNGGGALYVADGGLAYNTVVNSGGWVCVSSGGEANDTVVNYGATLSFAGDGGAANNTVINYGGRMSVNYGGTAKGTVVNSGASFTLGHECVGSNTVVSSGGRMEIYNGTVHRGRFQIENGAMVSVSSGATIDFTAAEQTDPGTALVNNWSLISGADKVSCTITVKADQAAGTYVLADGVANFDQTITLKTTDDTTLGTIAVGETKIFDDRDYTLAINADTLTLTVEGIVPKPAVSDYNGSDRSDMVQFVNGYVYVTHDTDSGYVQTPAVNYIPPDAWQVTETRRDLTGDGFADIQITSDDGYGGTWVATLRNDYLKTGCITLNYQFIGAYDNRLWSYVGSADFNADGKSEILMIQTDAGKDPQGHRNVVAWVTDEESCLWVDNIWLGALNDDWNVAGTADLTGDGADNVILSRTDGMIGYWDTAGSNNIVELKNAGYRSMLTTGDFDGDGTDDFLWRATGSDEFSTWTGVDGEMTDTVIGRESDLGGNWLFAGVGDYNADGKDELLWCDTGTYQMAYSEGSKENFMNLTLIS